MTDPNFKPSRDRFGTLLTIQDPTDPSRRVFHYPPPEQDHICSIYGYCAYHGTTHEHPKPKRTRRGKMRVGD